MYMHALLFAPVCLIIKKIHFALFFIVSFVSSRGNSIGFINYVETVQVVQRAINIKRRSFRSKLNIHLLNNLK